MKSIMMISAFLVSFSSTSFASGVQFDFEVAPKAASVIPAATTSCLSHRKGIDVFDVAPNYVRFPKLWIAFPNQQESLVIDSLEVSIQGLSGGTYKKTIAGDELLALNSTWYMAGEAVIGGPKGRIVYRNRGQTYDPAQTVVADCPLILGGLPGGSAYTATVSITAFGYSEDISGNPTPAQSQVITTINHRGN